MAVIKPADIYAPVPNDTNYTNKLWIPPAHEERDIFYYDSTNDKWVHIGKVFSTRYLQISDTAPTDDNIVYWVDTSAEPYVLKVKDANGNWKELEY